MTVADDLARTVREALDYLDDAHTWDAKKALDALVAQAVADVPEGAVADDLATLRGVGAWLGSMSNRVVTDADLVHIIPEIEQTTARVEDEIARLEAAVGEIGANSIRNLGAMKRWRERAEAAEDEIARLIEQRDTLYRLNQKQVDLVRAAEAREARLRDGLRELADEYAKEYSPHEKPLRALLAEAGAAYVPSEHRYPEGDEGAP